MNEDSEGKFDDEARALLVKHEANAVLVIVIAGKNGSGFSMAASRAGMDAVVPGLLRDVAAEIEKDQAGRPS